DEGRAEHENMNLCRLDRIGDFGRPIVSSPDPRVGPKVYFECTLDGPQMSPHFVESSVIVVGIGNETLQHHSSNRIQRLVWIALVANSVSGFQCGSLPLSASLDSIRA